MTALPDTLPDNKIEFRVGEPGSAELVANAEGIIDVLLAYQQEAWSLVSRHALLVAEKSRRIGYTWAVAAYVTLTASTARSAGGQDALYMGPNLEMAREFIDACALFARAFHWAAGEIEETVFSYADENGDTKEIKAFRIEFASGFEIVALTSNPRSLRGRQGIVVIDEAAFHDNLNEVLKAALALLMWGGRVIVISTHDGDDNAFNELVEEIRAGRRKGAVHRVTLSDAVREGLYARIALVKNLDPSPEAEAEWVADIRASYGDAAEEELDVIPQPGSGTAIPLAVLEKAARRDIPVLRWKAPKDLMLVSEEVREIVVRDFIEREIRPHAARLNRNWPSYLGGDFGRRVDLSVFWPVQVADDLTRRPPFIVELSDVPFEAQKMILYAIIDLLPRFSGGALDATGNGAYLAEVAQMKYGTDMIVAVHFSEGFYRENSPRLVASFTDGCARIPKDRDIISDHRMAKRIGGVIKLPPERKAGEGGGKRHGDAFIAHLLGEYSTTRDAVAYEGAQTVAGEISGEQEKRLTMRPDNRDDDMPGGGSMGIRGTF